MGSCYSIPLLDKGNLHTFSNEIVLLSRSDGNVFGTNAVLVQGDGFHHHVSIQSGKRVCLGDPSESPFDIITRKEWKTCLAPCNWSGNTQGCVFYLLNDKISFLTDGIFSS